MVSHVELNNSTSASIGETKINKEEISAEASKRLLGAARKEN